jgi:hypothetical protein
MLKKEKKMARSVKMRRQMGEPQPKQSREEDTYEPKSVQVRRIYTKSDTI